MSLDVNMPAESGAFAVTLRQDEIFGRASYGGIWSRLRNLNRVYCEIDVSF
jgi:hypothetical protein